MGYPEYSPAPYVPTAPPPDAYAPPMQGAVSRRYREDILAWVRPIILQMVKDAIRSVGITPGESAVSQVAPMVTPPTGDAVQDEINASKALKRIEKAAVKKAAVIKSAAVKKGFPMPAKTAVKKAVTQVVASRAPKLLRAAKRVA